MDSVIAAAFFVSRPPPGLHTDRASFPAGAITTVPLFGWIQILAVAALFELKLWKQDTESMVRSQGPGAGHTGNH